MRADSKRLVELVETQLGSQLRFPLTTQMPWDRDQHGRLWIIDQVLSDDEPCFNCFSETDFVRQQIALNRVSEDASDGRNLVGYEFDPCRDQGRHALGGVS